MVGIPLASVMEAWPEPIRQEIAALKLTGGHILIPVEEMGRGLKFGKVAFAWKQILEWTDKSLAGATKEGQTTLDLPLKIVAPLYLARNKPAAPQKKITISDSIPDMFAAKAATAAAAAPAVAPAPAAAPVPAPAPAPVAAPAPAAAPVEVVRKAAGLPGVTGALVASEDGLSVAAQLPAALKADNVAAFVPKMFGTVAQCARDLGSGQLTVLHFVAGNSVWRITKCGKSFLAVSGQAGTPLPETELEKIGQDLARL